MTANAKGNDLSAYWFGKADQALRAAGDDRAAGRFDFALNRAYYAAFYAATAVLQQRGLTFHRHSALRSAVHRELVKRELVPKDLGRAFDRLAENRLRADYLPLIETDAEMTEAAIGSATDLVAALKRIATAGDAAP